MSKDDDKKPQSAPYIDQRVTSSGKQGGITAHSVHFAPQDRRLDAGMKQQLLQLLPKDHNIKVEAPMGDGEAIRFSQEVWDFLSAAGYPMHEGGLAQCIWMPPPRGQRIDIESEAGVAKVVIDHR